ncbi:MAG: HPr family phosphocarrier protein [Phycisphaeraceae bacterium]
MSADDRRIITVKIVNRLGMHARPAMAFVDIANQFKSAVTVRKLDQAVDGKSIMQMMMLAAVQGAELQIEAIGPDNDQALQNLAALVNRGFDED